MYREADRLLVARNLVGKQTNMTERNAARVAVEIREFYGLLKGTELSARIFMFCKARIKGQSRIEAYVYAQKMDVSAFLA